MRPLNCFKFYKLKVITYDISGQGSLPGRRMLLFIRILPPGTVIIVQVNVLFQLLGASINYFIRACAGPARLLIR